MAVDAFELKIEDENGTGEDGNKLVGIGIVLLRSSALNDTFKPEGCDNR